MEIQSVLSSAVANQTQQPVTKPVADEAAKQQQASSSVVSLPSDNQVSSVKELAAQAEQLNKQMERIGQSLSFSVDESTQSSVVKIIDKTTDEVIKQFPTEGALKVMKNIQNYLESVQQSGVSGKEGLTGALFNEII